MKLFTGDPTHTHRKSDRWADGVSIVLGTLFGIVAAAVISSEAIYLIGIRFGLVTDRGEADLWGSLLTSTSAGLVSAAFLAGTPKEIGMAFLRKWFGNGRGNTTTPPEASP